MGNRTANRRGNYPHSDGRKQIDAARYYLKLLKDRYEGHGEPLTDDEKAEYFYLDGEQSKGGRASGKQISEIVRKHGKPGTLTVSG
jgi:hypothetical protein